MNIHKIIVLDKSGQRVITLLLRKIDVPQDEIEKFVEKIDERGISEMLAIENYSVQETRRLARAEADHRADEEP